MTDTSPITYDSRSFKKNNKPFLILSGSAHYIRIHPSRWDDLFETFLTAHLNTIETYIFWNAHEGTPEVSLPLPPNPTARPRTYNFSGRLDIFSFIAAAGEKGLNVILRIGPYVCAEVSYGGLPFRLREIPGLEFRTWNAEFMSEVEAWVRHIARKLHEKHLLAPAGGPVILVQLENEYSMVCDGYGDAGKRYLQWVADLQKELSFGVPSIMCYGAAEGVVETINAFYGHMEIGEHRRRHEDQPMVWTECWTGWYDVWGAGHHEREEKDVAYAVARFFAEGGAGVNYYMWMGGSNFGREGMYLQTTSYDYDAPIDEFCQETTKARHVGRLHKVLIEKFGDGGFTVEKLVGKGVVYRWGEKVWFVCNDGTEEICGVELVDGEGEVVMYDRVVGGKSVHIVDREGRLLFDTGTVQKEDVVTRERVKVETELVTGWEFAKERVPTWETVEEIWRESGKVRPMGHGDMPVEQLGLTWDTSDYCFYTARFCRKKGGKGGVGKLRFELMDFGYVFLDGVYVGRSCVPLWEDRWRNRWNGYEDGERGMEHCVEVEVGEKSVVDVSILCAAVGLVKGDWQLGEGRTMGEERKGLIGEVEFVGWERMTGWKALGRLQGEVGRYGCGGFVEGGDCGGVRPIWMKCVLKVEKVGGNFVMDLGEGGKGMVYVNGVLLGRFWGVVGSRGRNGFLDGMPVKQVRLGEATQRYYHVPRWVIGDERLLEVVLFVEYGDIPDILHVFAVE